MLKTLQKIYEGADLNAPQSGLMYFRIEENSTIKEISIYADSPVSADAVFNCSLNGTNLFSGADKPQIASGTSSGNKTGLLISAAKGDKFLLSLESVTGTVDAPVTILLTIDDGVSSGGGGGGSSLYSPDNPPASPGTQDDEFNSSTLDGKWVVTSPTSITAPYAINKGGNSHLIVKFPVGNGGSMLFSQNFTLPPSGIDYSITAKMNLAGIGEARGHYQYFGIRMDYPAAAWYQDIIVRTNPSSAGLRVQVSGNPGAYSMTSGLATLAQYTDENGVPKVYLHYQRVAGVYKIFYSMDGIVWVQVDQGTANDNLNHTKACLIFDTYNYSAVEMQAACDWFRRDWLFL